MDTQHVTADLTDNFVPRQFASGGAAAAESALPLHALRKSRGVRLVELAGRLAVGRPAVAKIERRAGIRVANLRRYVEALGGTLTITARFPDGAVEIAEGGAAER